MFQTYARMPTPSPTVSPSVFPPPRLLLLDRPSCPRALFKALRVCFRASPRPVFLLLLRSSRPHMLSAPPPLIWFFKLPLARVSDAHNRRRWLAGRQHWARLRPDRTQASSTPSLLAPGSSPALRPRCD